MALILAAYFIKGDKHPMISAYLPCDIPLFFKRTEAFYIVIRLLTSESDDSFFYQHKRLVEHILGR